MGMGFLAAKQTNPNTTPNLNSAQTHRIQLVAWLPLSGTVLGSSQSGGAASFPLNLMPALLCSLSKTRALLVQEAMSGKCMSRARGSRRGATWRRRTGVPEQASRIHA